MHPGKSYFIPRERQKGIERACSLQLPTTCPARVRTSAVNSLQLPPDNYPNAFPSDTGNGSAVRHPPPLTPGVGLKPHGDYLLDLTSGGPGRGDEVRKGLSRPGTARLG